MDELKRGYRECIELMEEWGKLALSSDYAGLEDKAQLAKDIARHKDIWLGRSVETPSVDRMWLCRTCQTPCSVDSPFCSDACFAAGL